MRNYTGFYGPIFCFAIAIGFLPLITGVPTFSGAKSCGTLIQSLELTAIGIEPEGNWALLRSVASTDEEYFSEGDIAFSCVKIEKVQRSGALIKDISSGAERVVYMGGVGDSAAFVRTNWLKLQPDLSREAIGGDLTHDQSMTDSRIEELLNVVNGTKSENVSKNVTRIHFPPRSNRSGFPQSIYWNEMGDELFKDSNALGIGYDAEITDDGLKVGANSLNSVLGGYGFIKGDTIASIGGYEIKKIEDVGRLLKNGSEKPIAIVYKNGLVKDGGLITTYLALLPRSISAR